MKGRFSIVHIGVLVALLGWFAPWARGCGEGDTYSGARVSVDIVPDALPKCLKGIKTCEKDDMVVFTLIPIAPILLVAAAAVAFARRRRWEVGLACACVVPAAAVFAYGLAHDLLPFLWGFWVFAGGSALVLLGALLDLRRPSRKAGTS